MLQRIATIGAPGASPEWTPPLDVRPQTRAL
jgi:hypothetical protein